MTMCGATRPGGPYTDIKHVFPSACFDAKIEGLVWHDLRATYGTRLGEAGFNAYDIAKLMGHVNISTSQRYVRNLPVGSGEAVMLKNQRRHSYRHKRRFGHFDARCKYLIIKVWRGSSAG